MVWYGLVWFGLVWKAQNPQPSVSQEGGHRAARAAKRLKREVNSSHTRAQCLQLGEAALSAP